MPAVLKIFLIPLKHRHKTHITFTKPDFSVSLQEISGITTNFPVFLLLRNKHDERMGIFYPAKYIAGMKLFSGESF